MCLVGRDGERSKDAWSGRRFVSCEHVPRFVAAPEREEALRDQHAQATGRQRPVGILSMLQGVREPASL